MISSISLLLCFGFACARSIIFYTPSRIQEVEAFQWRCSTSFSSSLLPPRQINYRHQVPHRARTRRRNYFIITAKSHNDGEEEQDEEEQDRKPSSSISSPGQVKQRIYQSTSRESRIAALEFEQQQQQQQKNPSPHHINDDDPMAWSDSKQAELDGLLRVSSKFEEPYDETAFDEDHIRFKQSHNEAFLALVRYCQTQRRRKQRTVEEHEQLYEEDDQFEKVNVFFLDGPNGGTASVLLDEGGLDPSQCFVANRHETTCHKLRVVGGGQLPDENVVHAPATEALRRRTVPDDAVSVTRAPDNNDIDDIIDDGITSLVPGPLAHLDFAAYYFDGCGGYVPQMIDMISAALARDDPDPARHKHSTMKTTAIGYSLLGGNKDVVHKEMLICQAVNTIAKRHNMRMYHVFDDPERYGISNDIRKVGGTEGQTFTTWLVIE